MSECCPYALSNSARLGLAEVEETRDLGRLFSLGKSNNVRRSRMRTSSGRLRHSPGGACSWQTVHVTSAPLTTAIRPGFRVMRGSTLTIPAGGLRISISEHGSPKPEIIRVQASIQTWTNWLVIAFARLGDTRAARKRMAEATANNDDATESVALNEEFQGSLQAISAAVFSLDAFYGVIHTMIVLQESEKKAHQHKRTSRAKWVADAIGRASCMPNEARKTVAKNIHTAYKLRDGAVHPHFRAEEYGIHPGLNQAGVHLFKRCVISGCFGHAARLRCSMVSSS